MEVVLAEGMLCIVVGMNCMGVVEDKWLCRRVLGKAEAQGKALAVRNALLPGKVAESRIAGKQLRVGMGLVPGKDLVGVELAGKLGTAAGKDMVRLQGMVAVEVLAVLAGDMMGKESLCN